MIEYLKDPRGANSDEKMIKTERRDTVIEIGASYDEGGECGSRNNPHPSTPWPQPTSPIVVSCWQRSRRSRPASTTGRLRIAQLEATMMELAAKREGDARPVPTAQRGQGGATSSGSSSD